MKQLQGRPPESEADFTQAFLQLLDLYKWPKELRYHTLRSKGATSGFPDWIIARPAIYHRGDVLDLKGRLLAIELKGDKGKTTLVQALWIDAFQAVGIEAYIWWPHDRDLMEEVLR